jgi:hypothetical protein
VGDEARIDRCDEEDVLSIRLTHSEDVERFCEFLRAAQVHTETGRDGMVRVSLTGAPTPLHARRELTGYVRTWNALNPGRHGEVV